MKTATRILRVEDEYNATFASVVKSYADAGHSMTDTAGIIDMCHKVFIGIVDDMQWRDWFVEGRDSLAVRQPVEYAPRFISRKGTGVTTSVCIKARSIYQQYRSFMYNGRSDTITGHAGYRNLNRKKMIRIMHAEGVIDDDGRLTTPSETGQERMQAVSLASLNAILRRS